MASYGSIGGRALIGGDILTKNVSYKDTPVAITSWSYVGTTITLNVASHTLVAGDYIEVGGLTATTNVPNGVHLVTSITATTIVFTYALTPTGTAGVSSATVKGYMTTNGRTNGIGEGQTWQDVTASRSAGVTYTNTTGRPIVAIGSWSSSVSANTYAVVNGVIVGQINSSSYVGTVTAIIPNGGTYTFCASGGVMQRWSELR